MSSSDSLLKKPGNRRSFLKKGALAAGAAVGAGLLAGKASALALQNGENSEPTKGDIAILQLLLAAEIIETDLWNQYRELGGIEATGSVSQPYITALQQLDGDMPQYISDNTDDEISHVAFLTAFLKSKGQNRLTLATFSIWSHPKSPEFRKPAG